MSEVPRDPSEYSPTTHAAQRAKYRGIEWHYVAETIREGETRQSPKEDCTLLVKEWHKYEHPVGVVVNYESGEILTVMFRE